MSAGRESGDRSFNDYPRVRAALIARISGFATQLDLSATLIEEIVKGQKVFIDGARGAVREAGWDVDQFEFNQSYLSAFVHSHPVSFMRADQQKIPFSEPSTFQLTFCLHVIRIAAQHTADVARRMDTFSLFPSGDPLGQVDD